MTKPKYCEWKKVFVCGNGDFIYDTKCGKQQAITRRFIYCPYCGKKIKEVK